MVANANIRTGAVTALVAAYNCGAPLRASIESLLAQTYADLEIIIVDDGSTDGSIATIADLVDDPRVTLISQDNAGKSAALNRAVEQASGEFLMIHDGDDLSVPERVATLVARLQAEPDLGGVMSRHALVVDDRVFAARRRGADAAACAAAVEAITQPAHDPTLLFRRAAVGTPVFDPELRIGQGVDLVLRIGETRGLVVVPEPLYHYRVDPGTHTRRNLDRTMAFSKLVWEKALRRRGRDPEAEAWEPNLPGARPIGHVVDAALDARVLDGRSAAARVVVDALRAFGPRWPWWKPIVYAVAPMSAIVRKRPDVVPDLRAQP